MGGKHHFEIVSPLKQYARSTVQPFIKVRNRAEIPVLGEDAFPDIDKTRIGLKGSPTHVKKSFVPPRKQGGVMIKEESNTASAQKLVAMLSEAHLI